MAELRRDPLRVVGQVYPWDLADDGARRAEGWRRLGVHDVAVALYYHAVRAVRWAADGTPRVVTEDASALYVPPSPTGARDRPAITAGVPSSVPPDAGVAAVAAARRAGLGTRAWVALTHHDAPAGADRPHAVVDAWGNRSAHALCPSHPEVRDFGRAVLRQVHAATGITEFLVESVASLGITHGSAHDKLAHAWLDPSWTDALSLCTCHGCRAAGERLGVDVAATASAVRAAVAGPRGQGVTDDLLEGARAVRRLVADDFLAELADVAGSLGGRVTVAATTDDRSTSAYAPVSLAQDLPVTGCAHLSAPAGRGWEDVRAWRESGVRRVAGVVDMLPPHPSLAGALRATHPEPSLHLVDELYLYHLGLRRPDTLDELRIDEVTTHHSPLGGAA